MRQAMTVEGAKCWLQAAVCLGVVPCLLEELIGARPVEGRDTPRNFLSREKFTFRIIHDCV